MSPILYAALAAAATFTPYDFRIGMSLAEVKLLAPTAICSDGADLEADMTCELAADSPAAASLDFVCDRLGRIRFHDTSTYARLLQSLRQKHGEPARMLGPDNREASMWERAGTIITLSGDPASSAPARLELLADWFTPEQLRRHAALREERFGGEAFESRCRPEV